MNTNAKTIEISNILKVLGAPFRIELLNEIGSGEACVCHLVAVFKRRQAFISQHLMVMRDACILKTRRESKYIYYSVADMEIFSILKKTAEMLGAEDEDVLSVSSKNPISNCSCPKCEEL